MSWLLIHGSFPWECIRTAGMDGFGYVERLLLFFLKIYSCVFRIEKIQVCIALAWYTLLCIPLKFAGLKNCEYECCLHEKE